MEELLAVADDRRVLKERPDMVQSRQTVNGRSRVKFMDGNTYSTFSGNQPSQAPFVNPQRVEQSSTQSGRFFNFSWLFTITSYFDHCFSEEDYVAEGSDIPSQHVVPQYLAEYLRLEFLQEESVSACLADDSSNATVLQAEL